MCDVVEIVRSVQGTPTQKLIAVLEAAGLTDATEIANLLGVTDRAVRKARNHSSGTTVPNGTTVPEPQFRDRNSSSENGTTVPPSARVVNKTNNLTNNLEPTVVGASPLAPPTPKGSRLSADWELPDEWRQWAEIHFNSDRRIIAIEAEKFRDFWCAKPGKDGRKTDWLATWRNWCRNAKPLPASLVQRIAPKPPPAEPDAAAIARRRREHEAELVRLGT